MDLGCSMDRTGAPSWTSVEVKLEDWDCRSLSLCVVSSVFSLKFETRPSNSCLSQSENNNNSLNRILITASSRSKCVGPLHTCK